MSLDEQVSDTDESRDIDHSAVVVVVGQQEESDSGEVAAEFRSETDCTWN
jgi:hypothetical protein